MNQTEIINEIEQCFISKEAYPKVKKYKDQFKEQERQYYRYHSLMAPIICEAISNTMTEGSPISKLLALRLCKELMDHKTEGIARQVAEKLLSKMKQIAQFRKNDKNDGRGQFLFSDNPTKETAAIGNSLMRLCLECIKVWGMWFQFSGFKVAYDELYNDGVQFPAKYTYFKEYNDSQSLQQSLILSSNSSKEVPVKQSNIKTTKVDAKQLQTMIKQELEFIGEILKGNENDQSINYLGQAMNNFEQFKPQLESSLIQILDSGEEALINDLVLKQDNIETLLNEYTQYLNKKINWIQLAKKYTQLCPQQHSTPQPLMSSIIQPPKQKNDQTLSVIREEDTNNDIDKSQKIQSKLIPDPQGASHKTMVQSQQQQNQMKSKQIYKALSLNLEEEENSKTQDQTFKQTDYTTTKQSRGQNFTHTLLESNQIKANCQRKEESKIMTPKKNEKPFEPPEDEIIVEESKPQSQINNSTQKQLFASNLRGQLEQSEQLKVFSSQDLIVSQQQKTQKIASKIEQTIQDSTVKLDYTETPVNQIQESRINQSKKKISRPNVDPFLTLDIPSEMQPQPQFEQQSLSLSQVQKRRNNSVQPSLSHSGKRETYVLDKFEIDILREENRQLKQDMVNMRDLYEQKQKQHTSEIEDKINEITKLHKLINELDLSKQDNKQQILQRFQETESLAIELQTLQYRYKQLQQQFEQQTIQLDTQQKEMALKAKQIQMQNVEICKLKSQLTQDIEKKRRSESVGQYSKTAQQFHHNQRIYKEVDYDIPQLTESQRNLIYPFTNPYEYYRDRLKKNQKGQVIQQTSEWKRVNIDPNNQILLKSAIISQQSMLYTNKQLEVGCKLEKINDQTLILHLYFMNANKLSSYKIDCQFSFANEVLTRAQKRKSFQLYQDSSEDISIEYSVSKIPLGLSSMNVTITSAKNITQQIYLPITIFPFIQFLNITLKEYRSYWKIAKIHLIRSDPFLYNKESLGDIFNKYMSVIELNSHKKREFLAGIDEIKYGSIIQCRSSNYLVRYILQPNNLMVIQMAYLKGRQNHSEHILNNFVFILSQ